jgi:hypothetical protein
VAFKATFQDAGMTLELQPKFEIAPRHVVVHLPWFVKASFARADGKEVAIRENRIELPATARRLDVVFVRQDGVAGISYSAAVEAYKTEYRARYDKFLREGSPEPTPVVVY